MRTIGHWINGGVATGTSTRSSVVYNPATGQQQAQVQLASAAEVHAVVEVARVASEKWRRTGLSRRAEIMFRLRELIDANRNELAALVTAEHGKVLSD
ncbi:MAG: aldehyde dehydrogenase family protein, partial [Acidimicrobiales bacterium]|nr:aldehyde dehydrogenase family protein [Acidimicrobiales bacterium]